MSVDTQNSGSAIEFSPPTQFSLSDLSNGVNFDDYLEELEKRMSQETSDDLSPTTDIYTQLQQKERDLLLAAELGKALLERNEELTKRQEVITKDYSARVEVSR